MRRRLADIGYTVLECYLQENWAQDASWINIILAFRRNLQQVPDSKTFNVGGSGWLSLLYRVYQKRYTKPIKHNLKLVNSIDNM